ncbi:MAG: hypothetical protein ACPKNR_00645 [Pleomorphochaeta sp.]
MKKRFITLLALLVLLPVMVFATDVVITWEWMLDDPQITGFRYQLNGEDPENWVVVDANTTSCAIQNLDGSKEYTLYLQQTYDGVNWSPSASSTAMPLFAEETTEVAQAPTIAEPTPEVVASEPKAEEVKAPVKEETVAAPKAVKTKVPYYTSVSLRGSGVYTLAEIAGTSTTYDQYNASVGLGLGFNNILAFSKVGFGLNIDTDFLVVPTSGNAMAALKSFFLDTSLSDYSLRVTVAPEMELNFNRVVVDVAPFVDATIVNYPYIGGLDYPADFYNYFLIGYGAQLGLGVKVNDHIQIAADAKFRKIGGMSDWNDLNKWGVEVTPNIKLMF